MQSKLAGLALMFMMAMSGSDAAGFDYRAYQCFAHDATALEHQDKWKRIHWITDFNAAMEQAKRENKPLLVFLVANFRGQLGATDC